MALLTDRTLAQSTAITPTTLIHIVTTGDTTQNPAGSSYKAELGQLNSIFTGTTFTGGSSNCIADFYVTNVHGCSPITIHDQVQSTGSTATGILSFAFGDTVFAVGNYSFSIGYQTSASTDNSHAEGYITLASGDTIGSHSEGAMTSSYGAGSHAEGFFTMTLGPGSHSEGYNTTTYDYYSHAEGSYTKASGESTHSEGYYTNAIGLYSHAEGSFTNSIGESSHTEGQHSYTYGDFSHAEGSYTVSSGESSHSEGYYTNSKGDHSHSEGDYTSAIGLGSHSEGSGTTATGNYSHAEGLSTSATTLGSHTEGLGTITGADYQHACGQFNLPLDVQSAFMVGSGSDDANRSNVLTAYGTNVNVFGDLYVTGNTTIEGTQKISTTGITASTFTITYDKTYWGVDYNGNVDLTLPNPTSNDGRNFFIKDEGGYSGTYRIRLTPSAGLIDGNTYVDMNINYMSLHLVARNNNWWII